MNPQRASRLAILGLILGSVAAWAQPDSAEAGEVSFFSGFAAGSLGIQPTVGGSTGRAFSRYAMALIDTSYTPLDVHTLRYYPGVVTAASRLYDFNFSFHIRIPVRDRWAPYAIIGGGLLFNTFDKQIIQPGGVAYFDGKSYLAFGFQTGGGLRYYVNDSWGIRTEYRYTQSTHSFSRVLGGVFYQFEGDFFFRGRHGGGRVHRQLR